MMWLNFIIIFFQLSGQLSTTNYCISYQYSFDTIVDELFKIKLTISDLKSNKLKKAYKNIIELKFQNKVEAVVFWRTAMQLIRLPIWNTMIVGKTSGFDMLPYYGKQLWKHLYLKILSRNKVKNQKDQLEVIEK